MTSKPVFAHGFAMLSAIALGTAAHAQETGSLIKRYKAAQLDDSRGKGAARIVAEQFGACVLDRSQGRVTKWVELPAGSAEANDLLGSLVSYEDDCISNGQLSVGHASLRGAVFQAMYIRTFAKKPVPAFAPELKTGYRESYGVDVPPAARNTVALEQFGECVTKANPDATRRLLLSVAESGGETGIFAELSPSFSACIVQGEQLKFSKLILKGALAEGMFRLTRAATAGKA